MTRNVLLLGRLDTGGGANEPPAGQQI
jgi:hypothetical protein